MFLRLLLLPELPSFPKIICHKQFRHHHQTPNGGTPSMVIRHHKESFTSNAWTPLQTTFWVHDVSDSILANQRLATQGYIKYLCVFCISFYSHVHFCSGPKDYLSGSWNLPRVVLGSWKVRNVSLVNVYHLSKITLFSLQSNLPRYEHDHCFSIHKWYGRGGGEP